MSEEPSELEEIVVNVDQRGFMVRPSDGRALEKATGKTFDEVMSTDDVLERSQMFAFMELRRRERADQPNPARGVYDYRDPAETWEMAAEVDVAYGLPQEVPRPAPLDDASS